MRLRRGPGRPREIPEPDGSPHNSGSGYVLSVVAAGVVLYWLWNVFTLAYDLITGA